MKFRWTNSSMKVLDRVKNIVILNYEKKEPKKFTIKITKKKEFFVSPIPFNNPAFQLYIQNTFYASYFYIDGIWKKVSEQKE